MKRLLPSLLAAVALAATAFPTLSAAQTPPARAAKGAAAPDTLAKLRAGKQINVAVSRDSFPMSFIKDKGEPIGYSIDLCKRVIAQLSRAVGVPELKTNWIVGTVSERIAMVASGKADLDCANTTAGMRDSEVTAFHLITIERPTSSLIASTSSLHRSIE